MRGLIYFHPMTVEARTVWELLRYLMRGYPGGTQGTELALFGNSILEVNLSNGHRKIKKMKNKSKNLRYKRPNLV